MSHIQNDTLNLEVCGGDVYPIVPAGTPLPFKSEPLHVLLLPQNCNVIRLPLYYGSGRTTSWPNRKIAERCLRFKRTYPADTPISIQVAVDEFGIISIRTWITDAQTELGTVTMVRGQQEQNKKKVKRKKAVLPKGPQGIRLNFQEECDELAQLISQRNEMYNQKNDSVNPIIKRQIRNIRRNMELAANPEEAGTAFNEALQKYVNLPTYTAALIGVAAKLYTFWPKEEQAIFHHFCRHIIRTIIDNRLYDHILDYYIQAVHALIVIHDEGDIPLLTGLLQADARGLSTEAAVTMAHIQADATPIIQAFLHLDETDIKKINKYAWAIGKLCSREMDTYEDMDLMEACAKRCCQYLNSTKLHNYNIKSTLLYTIGELCDQRKGIAHPLPAECNRLARKSLLDFEEEIRHVDVDINCICQLNLAKAMIDGLTVVGVVDAQLLALRHQFDD